jgi:4-hydroxymandelate oxidase
MPDLLDADNEAKARASLPEDVYDFIAGGSGDELSLAEAGPSWSDFRFRPFMLAGVSEASTATTVLGTPVRSPVLFAPVGYQRMLHHDGERAARIGTASAGGLYIAATQGTVPIEESAAASPDAPWWLQVYVFKDRAATLEIIDRAVASGARALVLTADVPGMSERRRDLRHGFVASKHVDMRNLGPKALERAGGDVGSIVRHHERGLTFDVIGELAAHSGLPVLVKGILRGDDAVRAVEHGAAGVVVSNHGGRQLDRAISPAHALAEVVDTLAGRGEVLVDGGISSSEDVLVALALGARAVLSGRPLLWALAAGGADGVRERLESYRRSLERTMRLAGVADARSVPRNLVVRVR